MPDGLPGPLSLHEIKTSPSLSAPLLAVEGGERRGGGGGQSLQLMYWLAIEQYGAMLHVLQAYLQLFLEGVVLSRRIEMKQQLMTPVLWQGVCVCWEKLIIVNLKSYKRGLKLIWTAPAYVPLLCCFLGVRQCSILQLLTKQVPEKEGDRKESWLHTSLG